MKKAYCTQHGQKIIVKQKGLICQVPVIQVSHITCDGNTATLHLTTMPQRHTSCVLIKDYESGLKDLGFLRVSRWCLINLNHVTHFYSTRRIVLLEGGLSIPVTRRRVGQLLAYLSATID